MKSWNLKNIFKVKKIYVFLVQSKKFSYINMKYLAIIMYYFKVIHVWKGKFLSNGNIFFFLILVFKGKCLEI